MIRWCGQVILMTTKPKQGLQCLLFTVTCTCTCIFQVLSIFGHFRLLLNMLIFDYLHRWRHTSLSCRATVLITGVCPSVQQMRKGKFIPWYNVFQWYNYQNIYCISRFKGTHALFKCVFIYRVYLNVLFHFSLGTLSAMSAFPFAFNPAPNLSSTRLHLTTSDARHFTNLWGKNRLESVSMR